MDVRPPDLLLELVELVVQIGWIEENVPRLVVEIDGLGGRLLTEVEGLGGRPGVGAPASGRCQRACVRCRIGRLWLDSHGRSDGVRRPC